MTKAPAEGTGHPRYAVVVHHLTKEEANTLAADLASWGLHFVLISPPETDPPAEKRDQPQ
jgi:hypothetical protein